MPQIVFVGSRMTGGDNLNSGDKYPAQTIALLEPVRYDSVVVAAIGRSAATIAGMAPKNIDPLYSPARTKNIVTMLEGQADLYQGASVKQTYIVLRDFCTARRTVGWKVVLLTLLPRKTEAIDAFPARAHFELDRQALNEKLRGGWRGFADALADIGANPEIGSTGAETNSEYYSPQALFLTAKGYRIVAEIVKDAVLTL